MGHRTEHTRHNHSEERRTLRRLLTEACEEDDGGDSDGATANTKEAAEESCDSADGDKDSTLGGHTETCCGCRGEDSRQRWDEDGDGEEEGTEEGLQSARVGRRGERGAQGRSEEGWEAD